MATPLKKQFPLEAQTEIGKCKCPVCGSDVIQLVSASGYVYAHCYAPRKESGRPCMAQLRLGGWDSMKMRQAYYVRTGKIADTKVKITPPEAANKNAPPIKAVDPKPAPQPQLKPKPKGVLDDYL